ncbi:hypothetical protein LELG_03797 [Lodderomyces elongisporus NRRL YB-4239]|uniref:Zn(2)-C6 fungal-type domain-containing protein n=1 Tax=Lodderomyces elongisporus (strain ATCC 11503 / CBS 2605 / JCM 1781 / NBRC 1676 / NRRL YB-4239) TaxID=379508 RepID=A5E2G0_LODEL|nr:hypothetical protein LELG_03797 [Lodderomyces elongisporus NRRL YB-4239]
MSDLLTYSIMQPQSGHHYLPAAMNSGFTTPKHTYKTILPPIHTLPSPSNSIHYYDSSELIKLPPINTNYTLNKPTLSSSSSFCSFSPKNPTATYNQLTELNLNRFDTTKNCHGLGLLSSAIVYDQQQQQQQQQQLQQQQQQKIYSPVQQNDRLVSLPSLRSSSSLSISSLSSPATPESIHNQAVPQPQPQPQPKQQEPKQPQQQKRRQRLGPSCDSCRARKVKCNAEITILGLDILGISTEFHLSPLQSSQLQSQGKIIIATGNLSIIYSRDKYIKFKPCTSCELKNTLCCFSKGFTKEDIMLNKKKNGTATFKKYTAKKSKGSKEAGLTNHPHQHAEQQQQVLMSINKTLVRVPSPQMAMTSFQTSTSNSSSSTQITESRRSSCSQCRKKKVKCVVAVVGEQSNRQCVNCSKRSHECLFD